VFFFELAMLNLIIFHIFMKDFIIKINSMKTLKILPIFYLLLILSNSSFGQKKSKLKYDLLFQKIEIEKLKSEIERLKFENKILEINSNKQIEILRSELKFIRESQTGNNYSKNNVKEGYESNNDDTSNSLNGNNSEKLPKNSSETPTKSNYGFTPSTGATIHTGPKGGKFYYNSKGNKTYVKKK
jgi:cell division protein FtsB